MQSDETFRPDTVDDQIDQLTPLSQSPNMRVVQGLSAYYEEEMRSTQHVWERLSSHMSENKTSIQEAHKQKDSFDRVPAEMVPQRKLELPLSRYTPPSRLGLVAATLFVALLVGSLLWILHMAHSTQAGHGLQTTTPSHGIYLSTSDGLSRLDLQTGKLLWHTKNQNQGQYNILYEPVILGNVLYLVEGSHMLVSLNVADGKVRWYHSFDDATVPGQMMLYASEGSLYFTSFRLGVNGSPIHSEEVVVYELNPATGTIKAAYKPPQTGWHNPRVVDHILYYTAGSNLCAEQLPTQKPLWQAPLLSQAGVQSQKMFIQNGRVYSMAGILGSQALEYTLIDAFDARTGKILWRSSQIPLDMKTLTIADTMVYADSYNGKVYAIDAQSGRLVWQQSFSTSDLLATSDLLYLSYNTHDANSQGLIALRAKDGAKFWQQSFAASSNNFSRLTLLNGIVYCLGNLNDSKTGESFVLYAFHASTGSLIWKRFLDTPAVEIA